MQAWPMPSCSVCPSVRLSVYLSRSWILSKRINISSKFFHHRVAKPFWFFHTEHHGNIAMGTLLMEVWNASAVGKNCEIWLHLCCVHVSACNTSVSGVRVGAALETRLKVVCCGLPSFHMVTRRTTEVETSEFVKYRLLRRSSTRFALSVSHITASRVR